MTTTDPAAPSSVLTQTLSHDYHAAGFGASLPRGQRPALVVVDLVQAYTTPGCSLYAQGFVDAVPSNLRLIAAARAAGVPVVLSGVVYGADGRDGGLFFRKVPALANFVKGHPMGEFVPGLSAEPGDVLLQKQYASSFFGTSLASTLTALRVDSVLVTGFSTSGCVRATALDALQHGFIPYVVREACGDRSAAPHEANLFDLQAKYADVIGEAEALALVAEAGATR